MRILCGTILAAAMAAQGASAPEDFVRWVDPFVGTSATGHTFPAACVPFGLVQPGPDTGNGSWDYCSGYRYGDKTICGFTQTHLNGTGCPDLGDVRILPFNTSAFSAPLREINPVKKLSEIAEPGYWGAEVKDLSRQAEIRFPAKSARYVRLAFTANPVNKRKVMSLDEVWIMGLGE